MNGVAEGLFVASDGSQKCWWCQGHDDYQQYHDNEWGRPVDDDCMLFEKICLEGFQSGLSWLTILRKRKNFREAFHGFDFRRVARFNSGNVVKLLQNKGIVRHRGKIEATINNAARAIEMADEFGSLAAWFWQFEPPQRETAFSAKAELCKHTTCDEAVQMSKALKKRGWKFVGPTTAYAFMQAMGMVNDHLSGCSQFDKIELQRSEFQRPRFDVH